ncbi:MAG: hypothetical protein M1829_006196 [Trizodia sp. TS-e1964]|nr:MAG: hypothetical protein M1829_006196 [Trizodia sp. TS-e1964]
MRISAAIVLLSAAYLVAAVPLQQQSTTSSSLALAEQSPHPAIRRAEPDSYLAPIAETSKLRRLNLLLYNAFYIDIPQEELMRNKGAPEKLELFSAYEDLRSVIRSAIDQDSSGVTSPMLALGIVKRLEILKASLAKYPGSYTNLNAFFYRWVLASSGDTM